MNLPQIRAGKAVVIPIIITRGAPPILIDPPSLPVVSIIDPNGILQVNANPSTKISIGIYQFIYITPTNGVLGDWAVFCDATDTAGNPSGSLKTPAFTLVAA